MLMLSATGFYISSRGPGSAIFGVLRRIDIANPASPTTVWSKYMNCPEGNNWGVGRSSAILSNDGLVLYTLTGVADNTAFKLSKF